MPHGKTEFVQVASRLYPILEADPLCASAYPYYGSATARITTPQSYWNGDPGSVFSIPRGGSPGQCKGCGAPGAVGSVCEYCGGKNIKEEQA